MSSERGGVMKRRQLAFLIAAGCLCPTVGSLTGMVVELARFNRQRRTLLQHLGATQERLLHIPLMDIGRQTQSPEAEMMPSFRAINDAHQSIDANLRTETS